jgi:hypothetical protein
MGGAGSRLMMRPQAGPASSECFVSAGTQDWLLGLFALERAPGDIGTDSADLHTPRDRATSPCWAVPTGNTNRADGSSICDPGFECVEFHISENQEKFSALISSERPPGSIPDPLVWSPRSPKGRTLSSLQK